MGRDHGVPVVVRHLVEEVVADDPRAGDDDVEPVCRGGGRLDRRLHLRPRGDVAAHRAAADPSAVSSAAARSKSATTTSAPSDASRAAVAAPIPRAAPVRSAILPANAASSEPSEHELRDADRLVAALALDRRAATTACSPPGTSSTEAP